MSKQQQNESEETICLSTESLVEVQILNIDDNVSQITEMENKRVKYSFPLINKLTPFYSKEQINISKLTSSKICHHGNQIEQARNNNVHVANVSDSEQFRVDCHRYQESMNVGIVDTARLDYLKSVPYLLSEYRNTRNMRALSCLIRDACTENCVLKTPSFASPLEGRYFIIEVLESVFRSIPDNKIEILSVKMSDDNKLISTNYIGTGTVVTRDTSDYLWNHLSNRIEYQSYSQKLRAKILRFGSNIAKIGSRVTGFMISFRAEITMDFVLNDQGTHIQAFVISAKILKIKIARGLNNFPQAI